MTAMDSHDPSQPSFYDSDPAESSSSAMAPRHRPMSPREDDEEASEENIFRYMSFEEILEDLSARFLNNLPQEEIEPVRAYWAAEQAFVAFPRSLFCISLISTDIGSTKTTSDLSNPSSPFSDRRTSLSSSSRNHRWRTSWAARVASTTTLCGHSIVATRRWFLYAAVFLSTSRVTR